MTDSAAKILELSLWNGRRHFVARSSRTVTFVTDAPVTIGENRQWLGEPTALPEWCDSVSVGTRRH
jgi:hypothetical protein